MGGGVRYGEDEEKGGKREGRVAKHGGRKNETVWARCNVVFKAKVGDKTRKDGLVDSW